MGYKGLEMTSPEEYLFSDAIPYNPEFDLEQLKQIQNKLENFTSGRSSEGITSQEAEIFLDWVTFNARSYAVKDVPESAMTSAMTGKCGPTQRVNVRTLSKMGLDVRAFNLANCIGEVPMNAEDIRRAQNGVNRTTTWHAVSLINLPIMDNYGNTQLYEYLLEPTIRQFFKKENCSYDKFLDQDYLSRGYVAPSVGYFMKADNLRNLGVPEEEAQKTEMLGRYLIHKGYCYLSEENAKLYGDTFARAARRLEFQNIPINTSGREYLNNFENDTVFIRQANEDDLYTRLPNELGIQPKQGFLSKVKGFFKRLVGKQPIALPEACPPEKTCYKNMDTRSALEAAKLTSEQLADFRRGTTQVLSNLENPYYSGQENMARGDFEGREVS